MRMIYLYSFGKYVLNEGSLLHCIVRRKDTTYQGIPNLYATFVIQFYGKAIVVFDDYGDTSHTV